VGVRVANTRGCKRSSGATALTLPAPAPDLRARGTVTSMEGRALEPTADASSAPRSSSPRPRKPTKSLSALASMSSAMRSPAGTVTGM
jgi:hypothetical protein